MADRSTPLGSPQHSALRPLQPHPPYTRSSAQIQHGPQYRFFVRLGVSESRFTLNGLLATRIISLSELIRLSLNFNQPPFTNPKEMKCVHRLILNHRKRGLRDISHRRASARTSSDIKLKMTRKYLSRYTKRTNLGQTHIFARQLYMLLGRAMSTIYHVLLIEDLPRIRLNMSLHRSCARSDVRIR
jgi:hypothetical protein